MDARKRLAPALTFLLPLAAQAADFELIREGRPRVAIDAPAENAVDGRRLSDRLAEWTGVRLPVSEGSSPADRGDDLVMIGTPETNASLREALAGEDRVKGLGEEGYLLKVTTWRGRRVLLAAGHTTTGAGYAVSELISWKVQLDGGSASVSGYLDESDSPSFQYRVLWAWDGANAWATRFSELESRVAGVTDIAGVASPMTKEGYLSYFKRSVDYACDHKLNGYIIWGFLRDQHGGVEAGRELSHYAKERHVRILPGTCTETAYGGFIFSDKNDFNLDVWSKKHPELRYKDAQGNFTAGICPSKLENQKWLRDGTRWLLENVPDIGGVNLENGDWMYCWTDDCTSAKAKPENDPNFFWDQMASYKPVMEEIGNLRPDLWVTFATYAGFTRNAIAGAMHGAVVTKRARDEATQIVYPPRFLNQMPPNGICQWTLTGMNSSTNWPEDARPPKGSYHANLGFMHQGSMWTAPVEKDRWWAAPGGMLDDASAFIQFICGRIQRAQMSGLVIQGEIGAISPANELNYVSLEYFTWHPERTWAQFVRDRLTLCYGGMERAELFLKLLDNTTRLLAEIEKDRQAVAHIVEAVDLDVRQRARWKHLGQELDRRKKKTQDPETFKAAVK